MHLILTLAVYFFCIQLLAEPFNFAPYVSLANEGKVEQARKKLSDIPNDKFDYSELHLKFFALGKWASDEKKWSESREHLEQAIKYGRTNAAHIFYLIGHTYKEENNFEKAADSFNSALDHNASQYIAFQTRFEFSDMALVKNQPRKAREHLHYLERRWRGTPQYPEVIWRLMATELKDNRKHVACRWARRLYSRYPADPLLADWGIELSQNKFEGKSIGCSASYREMKTRLNNLLLSGESERARKEIAKLSEDSKWKGRYDTDLLLVAHLERLGFPEEALAILIQHYDEKKTSVSYQKTLGKVAGKASEFQMAIGAYHKAFELSPRSSHGKEALFTAAFLSYQIQDYDGAYRKFSDLNSRFKGSGLARDSRWHMAWLQYLKSDYSGAEEAFQSLLAEKIYYRRKRYSRPFVNDRTKYWLAMSQLKQGKIEPARKIFEVLANDKLVGYYSLLAKNRVQQLPKTTLDRQVASEADKIKNEPEEIEVETSDIKEPGVLYSPNIQDKEQVEESEESLQAASENEDVVDDEPDETVSGPKFEAAQETSTESIEKAESVQVTTFRDPKLQERFQRASNLIRLGFDDWAKWELFEIEKRTRNKPYLKTLMDSYLQIGSYNRVAYIAEIYFSKERARGELKENSDIWMYNYPKAYSQLVEKNSQQFDVSEFVVLGIMKAESLFNKDAKSPVGARGLMQIMPYTADHLTRLLGDKSISPEDLLKPEVNIRLGTRYLSRLQKKFQNQLPLVAAGYNAGPHRVNSWLNSFGTVDMDEFIEHVPFVETRNYMKKVVRNYALYNELYSKEPIQYAWLTQPVPVRVSERPLPRENWEIID